VMHFGYDNRKADYFMDGVNLEHVTEKKDNSLYLVKT